MNAAFESFRGARYWPALDGLRALAILPVVAFHAMHHRGGLWGLGALGVELFFAISGFLITSLLLRERRATGHISLPQFYLRRSLRIFPLYYAVLLAYVLLVGVLERSSEAGEGFWRNLPFYATYTSNWAVETSGSRVIFYFAWSLACEEQFYLLWPGVVARTRPWGAAAAMAALLVALQLAPKGVALAGPICLGCLAALAIDDRSGFDLAYRVLGRRWSAPATAAALALALALSLPLLVVGAAMTALVVACTIRPDHGLALPLQWRPLRFVGEVSYGIYLFHMLAVNAVRRLVPHDDRLVLALAFPLVIAVAGASHRWFERPVLRLKDRFRVRRPEAAV